jgi:hypothetical protein
MDLTLHQPFKVASLPSEPNCNIMPIRLRQGLERGLVPPVDVSKRLFRIPLPDWVAPAVLYRLPVEEHHPQYDELEANQICRSFKKELVANSSSIFPVGSA